MKKLASAKKDIISILHLPFLERLLHVKSRRVIKVSSVGLLVMFSGVLIAQQGEWIEHQFGIHHSISDLVGYFIHGVGAVPFMRYIDPLWNLLAGAEEAASVA